MKRERPKMVTASRRPLLSMPTHHHHPKAGACRQLLRVNVKKRLLNCGVLWRLNELFNCLT